VDKYEKKKKRREDKREEEVMVFYIGKSKSERNTLAIVEIVRYTHPSKHTPITLI
jgi:hypothetical protein